ncbi:MAG: hypothetical protein KF812_05360 [Fimbriimonadaceae bacterium]|nr:hypothetical protein [Fimbriimonadaceae bacterium]
MMFNDAPPPCYISLLPHGDHYDAKLVQADRHVIVHLPNMEHTPQLLVLNDKLDFVAVGAIQEGERFFGNDSLMYTRNGRTVVPLRIPLNGSVVGELRNGTLLVTTQYNRESTSSCFLAAWTLKTGQFTSIAAFDRFHDVLAATQSGQRWVVKLQQTFFCSLYGQSQGWSREWRSRDYLSYTIVIKPSSIMIGDGETIHLAPHLVPQIITGNSSFVGVSISDHSINNTYGFYRGGHNMIDCIPSRDMIATYIFDLERGCLATYLPGTLAVYFPDPYRIGEWTRKFFFQSAGSTLE